MLDCRQTLSRLNQNVGSGWKVFILSIRAECTAGHRVAAFACEACGAEVMVPTSCGRLEEPTSCTGCGKNWTMKLLHNRCLFLNRQLIKMQVRPVISAHTLSSMVLILRCRAATAVCQSSFD